MNSVFRDPSEYQDTGVIGPRPYTLTRGRIHASRLLQLETLVQAASVLPAARSVLPEHQQILALCGQPRSVAEVSGLLCLPVGVMRVLVADLADEGLLRVFANDGRGPSVMMLERVLRGLERL